MLRAALGVVAKVEQLQVGVNMTASATCIRLGVDSNVWIEANFKEALLAPMWPAMMKAVQRVLVRF